MKVEVQIFLKTSVLDIQGETVAKTLRSNVSSKISTVRVGKVYILEFANVVPNSEIEAICDQFLSNSAIESYAYKVI